MTWLCTCGLFNNGYNRYCADQKCKLPANEPNTFDWLQSLVTRKEIQRLDEALKADETTLRRIYGASYKQMSDTNLDKHAEYFNHETLLIKDMTREQLRDHRNKMEAIAFETRTRLSAIVKRESELDADNPKTKEWLESGRYNDPNITETITKRKERMSSLDRMKAQFKQLGLEDDEIAEYMANIKNRATEKALKAIKATPAVKLGNVKSADAKPFDPASLAGLFPPKTAE